jgi:cytochrome b subunit of formate dehydrogenase
VWFISSPPPQPSISQGIFEQKIMNVCEVVILLTLIVTGVIVFVQIYVRNEDFQEVTFSKLNAWKREAIEAILVCCFDR